MKRGGNLGQERPLQQVTDQVLHRNRTTYCFPNRASRAQETGRHANVTTVSVAARHETYPAEFGCGWRL